MDAIINYYRNLPRTMQITLWLAVGVFTPIVSIVFGIFFNGIGAMFSLLGLVLGLLNWKGVLFFAIVGIFFAGKAAINFIENYEVEEDVQEDNSWDPFR
jgi:hypothetical protein